MKLKTKKVKKNKKLMQYVNDRRKGKAVNYLNSG
jgi:hypothetical protein